MSKKIEIFLKPFLKENLSEVRPGDTVSVHQKIREGEKEKIQAFEGVVIARKHGKEIGATITVRKVISGIGVERIFPLHSPTIEKIEILKRGKVRRAKLYYLRKAKGKKAKLKKKGFTKIAEKEESPEEISEIPQA
jgi:large subunit ribosomal protein L19